MDKGEKCIGIIIAILPKLFGQIDVTKTQIIMKIIYYSKMPVKKQK